jgi:hypothetical protein
LALRHARRTKPSKSPPNARGETTVAARRGIRRRASGRAVGGRAAAPAASGAGGSGGCHRASVAMPARARECEGKIARFSCGWGCSLRGLCGATVWVGPSRTNLGFSFSGRLVRPSCTKRMISFYWYISL